MSANVHDLFVQVYLSVNNSEHLFVFQQMFKMVGWFMAFFG
jgi:hypothetical protein